MPSVISTAVTNSPVVVSSSDDELLVTNDGAVLDYEDNQAIAIELNGASDTVIVDGTVGGWQEGIGAGASDTVVVNGAVSGAAGVLLWTGASDASVVVNGSVSGTSFGLDGGGVTDSQIVIGAQGVVSVGKSGDDAIVFDDSSSNSVQNNGLIAGGIGFLATGAGSNQISNAGEINSQSCAILLDETGDTGANALADANSINNSGTITAGVVAIKNEDSSDLNFNNSGVISAASNDALLFNDGAGVTDTINNSGKIVGHGFAIESDADALDIDNSGTIQGGLSMASGAAAIIDNLGLWQANVADDGLVLGAGSALATREPSTPRCRWSPARRRSRIPGRCAGRCHTTLPAAPTSLPIPASSRASSPSPTRPAATPSTTPPAARSPAASASPAPATA